MNKLIKQKNTFLSLIIILVFIIGLVPLNVNASSIEVLYNGSSIKEGTTKIGNGEIIFDKTNSILTLSNVDLKQSGSLNTVLDIVGNPTDILNIILSGNNSITTTSDQSAINSNVSLNIEGSGNLCINTSYIERETNAISVNGDLNISNTNITLMGKESYAGTAVYCDKTLNINKSTIYVEAFRSGLIAQNSYFNIRDSSINFKRVAFAITSFSYSDELSTLYNTGIDVIGKLNMVRFVSSNSLLIDECNFDNLESVSTTGIGGGLVTIKNSNIKLTCDQTAIKGHDRLDIIDSNLILTSYAGCGIETEGLLSFINSDVYIKAEQFTPVYTRRDQAITLPRDDLIVLDKNLEEVNNYKVVTSEYHSPMDATSLYDSVFTTDGLPLKIDNSNITRQIHLRIKKANYTKVDAALNNIPKDLSIYTDASVKSLNTCLNAVVRDLKITEQTTVDKYANDIYTAINDLKIKAPTISEGNNQTIEEGSYAVFRSNADIKDFLKVIVDGKDVAAINYDIKSGSTIITLKNSYLNSLSKGTHTIGIVSKNGTATTNFTIKKSSKPIPPKPVQPVEPTKPEVPQTGITDDSYTLLSIIILSGVIIIKQLKENKS